MNIKLKMALVVKNLPANAGDVRDWGFDPWVGKMPWRRKWKPTPVFLPGESHGQRSLMGYSPRGLTFHLHDQFDPSLPKNFYFNY